MLIILQEFFRKLEQLSGYEKVNLSNIWELEDVIFVEVQHSNAFICYLRLKSLGMYITEGDRQLKRFTPENRPTLITPQVETLIVCSIV